MEKGKKNKIDKNAIIWMIFFLLILAFCFFTMDYEDGHINAKVGYRMARGLFDGNFREVWNTESFTYGITIYSIYAIWSVPFIIIEKLFLGGRMTDLYTCGMEILWYKLLLVLFLGFAAYMFGKIVQLLTDSKEDAFWGAMLYLSSSVAFYPVLAMTQCDIMGISFMLCGIYALLRNKKLQFLVFFAIAATMKYMALFILIPLLLYQFKELKKLLPALIGGGSLLLIFLRIILTSTLAVGTYGNPENYVAGHITDLLTAASISVGSNDIMSISVAFYLIICLIAFISKGETEKENQQWILWFSLAGWYALLLFCDINTYWYALWAPFLLLLAFTNSKMRRFSFLLEALLTNAGLLKMIQTQWWVFGGKDTFATLALSKYVTVGQSGLLSAAERWIFFGYAEVLKPAFVAIVIVCAIMLLIVNYPGKVIGFENELNQSSVKEIKNATWVHLIILYVWTYLMVYEQFWGAR